MGNTLTRRSRSNSYPSNTNLKKTQVIEDKCVQNLENMDTHMGIPSAIGSLDEFELLKTTGTNSFGLVILVKHKANGDYFSMRIFSKEKVDRYIFIYTNHFM